MDKTYALLIGISMLTIVGAARREAIKSRKNARDNNGGFLLMASTQALIPWIIILIPLWAAKIYVALIVISGPYALIKPAVRRYIGVPGMIEYCLWCILGVLLFV